MCCHVHGFQPYFYASLPPNFTPDDVESFRKALNVRGGRAQVWRARAVRP